MKECKITINCSNGQVYKSQWLEIDELNWFYEILDNINTACYMQFPSEDGGDVIIPKYTLSSSVIQIVKR